MKNIHLLPTEKPSRLSFVKDRSSDVKDKLVLFNTEGEGSMTHHIYITSDDEIKEGDWVINPYTEYPYKADYKVVENFKQTKDFHIKKIILTTDQDLIADGVQVIDDTFLEWFVKNPNCEEVEVEIETTSIQLPQQQLSENSYDLAFRWINKKVYKIIIPQEEPILFESFDKEKSVVIKTMGQKLVRELQSTTQEETIEKIAENESEYLADWEDKDMYKKGFVDGAKWQQERSFSELFQWLASKDYLSDELLIIQKEFEQFKKK
jgi:hypothetical protein